jgi:ABC-2 type transport system permease protein
MRAAWAICRRDLVAAFTTPLMWLVLACWTFLVDAVFAWQLYEVRRIGAVDRPLFVGVFSAGIWFLMPLAPAITMNLFAAERAQGTLQLLLTAPIRERELVLGKFLAALIALLALVVMVLPLPIALAFVSAVAPAHLAVGLLGLALCCVLFAALGVWISLLVDSPVAAYVMTFAAIMALILVGLGGDHGVGAPIARAIGQTERTRAAFAGELRGGDVAYFLAGAAAPLVLATAALRARRLHG